MRTVTIGLLFPRSALYRSIGFDVSDAFKKGIAYYNQTGTDIRIATESVGVGADTKEIYKCAEKLLMQENADILVAYIDHYAAVNLEPLCNAAGKMLIIMEPGATIPDKWDASPSRFHVTLNSAVIGRHTALAALDAGVDKTAFCTTYYDGGYHNCGALINEFLEGDGEVKYNCIVPFKFEEFDITPLEEAINAYNVNGVLAQLSIECGNVFLDQYAKAGLPKRIPHFYASPFTFEEQFLETLKFPFEGIKGYVPWARQLDNATNAAFLKTMDEECNKQGNCFSALAWDTAQFVCKATAALLENKMNIMKAASALCDTEMDSTRGLMKLDNNTNYFIAPVYEAEIVRSDNGMSALKLGEEHSIERVWAKHAGKPMEGINSRWLNTYLCTS